MVKISRSNQILIFLAFLVFFVFFLVYFFKLATTAQIDLSGLKVNSKKAQSLFNPSTTNINLEFFNSEKFLDLRSDVAPVQSFSSGKRNPFQP